jgi:DNA-binding transcriptional MerR regulator
MLGNGHDRTDLPQKDLFRIGEVSRLTDTKAFVLRYWETEFPMLQPVKTPKGHRLYRREDIDMVLAIKRLLYEEGFTIAGARRHLGEPPENGQVRSHQKGNGHSPAESTADAACSSPAAAQRRPAVQKHALAELRKELRAILTLLEPR